jgi:hypothetical protein
LLFRYEKLCPPTFRKMYQYLKFAPGATNLAVFETAAYSCKN